MFKPEQIEKIKKVVDKAQAIEELKKREERYAYLGLLSEYQTQPKNLVQTICYTKLNPHQHFLFKRVLHGLNVYKPEEVQKMHWDKKRRIKKVWQRGQNELNMWKQVICNKRSNEIFRIFTNSSLAKGFVNASINDVDLTYKNKISLKDLGLTYDDLILFYISKGLLPKDFLSLKSIKNEKSLKKVSKAK